MLKAPIPCLPQETSVCSRRSRVAPVSIGGPLSITGNTLSAPGDLCLLQEIPCLLQEASL